MTNPAYAARQYRQNRRVVLEASGGKCSYPGCHRPATTADHIIPLSRGGGHDLENLRALCWHHNSLGGVAITNAIKKAKRMGRRSRTW